MAITITIPEDAPEKDRRRVRQTADVARRNTKIRRAYPKLRDEYGRDEAFDRLATQHDLQQSTVRAIVYGQR